VNNRAVGEKQKHTSLFIVSILLIKQNAYNNGAAAAAECTYSRSMDVPERSLLAVEYLPIEFFTFFVDSVNRIRKELSALNFCYALHSQTVKQLRRELNPWVVATIGQSNKCSAVSEIIRTYPMRVILTRACISFFFRRLAQISRDP
jgi:hypothetical protein